MSFGKRWEDFWFAPFSLKRIAVFRILIGVLFLVEFFTLPIFFTGMNESNYFAGGFYLPYFSWLKPPPFSVFLTLEGILLVSVFSSILGLFTRFSLLLASGIVFYFFFLNQLFYLNHVYLLGVMLFLTGLSPADRRFSLDSLFFGKGRELNSERESAWPLRLLQVLLSFVYFASALSKTNAGWWSGETIRLFYEAGNIRFPGFLEFLEKVPFALQGRMTLFTEYFLAFALWPRRTRNLALMVGVVFHSMMDLGMGIGTFSLQVLAIYFLFLERDEN